MKGDKLGEFEELTLLAVIALGGDAYGVTVQEYLEREAGREVTMGPIYAALDRLERKGFVRSEFGDSTPERGGKAKRHFDATRSGKAAARAMYEVRQHLWKGIAVAERRRP